MRADGRGGATASYRYPAGSIMVDYVRAATGLALTAGPLVVIDVAEVLSWILGGLALLFTWFALRTLVRHRTSVVVSDRSLLLSGTRSTEMAWADIQKVGLAYYAPRRGSGDGWMQLTLRDGRGAVLRIESSLDGFDHIVARVRHEIVRRGLDLDAATEANFAVLGGAGHPSSAT